MTSERRDAGGDPAADNRGVFTPETLDQTVVALPLLMEIEAKPDEPLDVIIDANLDYGGGRREARDRIMRLVDFILKRRVELNGPSVGTRDDGGSEDEGVLLAKSEFSHQYVFARLRGSTIRELVRRDRQGRHGGRAIYKVWLDHKVRRFTNKSASTVKADAARNAFGAVGEDIVWAVVDTGIDASHPHFATHDTLGVSAPLRHRDFTDQGVGPRSGGSERLEAQALQDESGHGTHVAGIIAGEFVPAAGGGVVAWVRSRNESGDITTEKVTNIPKMSGMAPHCKVLSLKVLDKDGEGLTSNIIAALEYIQDRNSNGRRLLIHGVNLSVGYDFEPKWFACGQSPLCVEVNRLVRSGVVVVVAAGNTGYGYNQPQFAGPVGAGLDVTINDPGNADLAITVGSTHRESPHVFGVSYFSSKGPTGDGRLKPDLLAPGEKIISCLSGRAKGAEGVPAGSGAYREDSGTSMAAPHVSGAIAAFLSIRREFIGHPERVKEIFLSSATDLGRAVYFQGRGLVDLMRALQSV